MLPLGENKTSATRERAYFPVNGCAAQPRQSAAQAVVREFTGTKHNRVHISQASPKQSDARRCFVR